MVGAKLVRLMAEVQFQRGQEVTFRVGTREVHGVIKEDRGPIGIQGRRLYLIEYPTDYAPGTRSLIELPGEQLAARSGAVRR